MLMLLLANSSQPSPRKYRVLIKVLSEFGIVVMKKGGRGKGSHRMLHHMDSGIHYPIKCRNENQEYSVSMQKAIQRKFKLPDTFWD